MKFLLVEDKIKDNYLAEDITLQDKHAVREFADECKEDGLPLMDYKEFSELLNEQGMKPNEELYQVYIDAYNNEEDTDYIEVIRKEFEKMSSNEIIDLLGIPNNSSIDIDSPMFILPNGSIISVAQAGKLNNMALADNVHADMMYVIFTKIAEKYGVDYDEYVGVIDENEYVNILTYGKDWARVNCGETWLEERFYCVLPNHMTSAQYYSLEKWLEWGYDSGKKEVLVFVGKDEVNQTYRFKETFPEDIIKKIKRYYSSGRLYESRNELKESMEELTKDFSKVSNPKSGDKLTIIDDKDREWNYVAYLWSSPGFTSGMAWKGQKGNPWVNDIAANPRAFNSEFSRGVKKVTINNMNESINNKLTPQQAAQAVKELKLKSNPNIDVHIDEYMQGVKVTFEGTLEGGKKIILWESNILSTQEQIDTLPDMYKKQSDKLDRLREVGYKGIKESNELEQRVKKHKKKSKGLGWYSGANFNSNAGDVEKGIEVFNNSTSSSSSTNSGEGTAMGEAISNNTNTYLYDGPIYYRGNKISDKSSIYTSAPTINIAARNILFRAANGAADFYNYDISDDKIKMIKPSEQPKPISKREICSHCGYELNDMGDCPVCDYGEYDLLDEGLSSLEALWTLHRNLDD